MNKKMSLKVCVILVMFLSTFDYIWSPLLLICYICVCISGHYQLIIKHNQVFIKRLLSQTLPEKPDSNTCIIYF